MSITNNQIECDNKYNRELEHTLVHILSKNRSALLIIFKNYIINLKKVVQMVF